MKQSKKNIQIKIENEKHQKGIPPLYYSPQKKVNSITRTFFSQPTNNIKEQIHTANNEGKNLKYTQTFRPESKKTQGNFFTPKNDINNTKLKLSNINNYISSINIKTPQKDKKMNYISLAHYSPLKKVTTPKPLNQMIIKNFKQSQISDETSLFSIMSNSNQAKIDISNINLKFTNYGQTRISDTSSEFVRAFAGHSFQGIFRNYNEDRITIIQKVACPSTNKCENWPIISFFAVYDGHGGSKCADFLKENLHNFIFQDESFPKDPQEAIKKGFQRAEREFITNFSLNSHGNISERSGSCALVILTVDSEIYAGNVGDSRAIMTFNGSKVKSFTRDHKPNDQSEKSRIALAGGRVYQTQIPPTLNRTSFIQNSLLGPHRIFPGRLSVSRSFGDIEAKDFRFGGNPNVLIAVPDVFKCKLSNDLKFVILGCDGIFDQLSNQEVMECAEICVKNQSGENIHKICGSIVDMIIKTSLVRKSLDNVTVIVVCFNNNANNAVVHSKTSEDIQNEIKVNINDENTCLKKIEEVKNESNNLKKEESLEVSRNKLFTRIQSSNNNRIYLKIKNSESIKLMSNRGDSTYARGKIHTTKHINTNKIDFGKKDSIKVLNISHK